MSGTSSVPPGDFCSRSDVLTTRLTAGPMPEHATVAQKIEQTLRFGPIPQMLEFTMRSHGRLSCLNVNIVLAVLTVGYPDFAQGANPELSFDAIPALALRIEGEPTIPIEELKTELELATGKPVKLQDQGSAGLIVVAFEAHPSGIPHVTVVYHPPLAELTRSDSLPNGLHEGAHHVGLLAQGLIQRNAGITLLTPEPKTKSLDATLGSCATSLELARPVAVKPSVDRDSSEPTARAPTDSVDDAWRSALGLRWGPMGFGTMTGAFSAEGGADSLSERAWMVGGTLHVDAPSSARFKLGIEAFLEQFAIGAPDDNTVETLQGSVVGLSAVPSIRLTPLNAPAEVRFAVGVGVAYSPVLEVSAEPDVTGFIDEGVGYRLSASLTGIGWVTHSLGVSLALGFEHTFMSGSAFGLLQPNETGQASGTVNGAADIWLNQPYLRLGVEYRM